MQKATINLAKGKGDPLVDQFIRWALTVGRVIVILTESLALGVFLYRFSLDRQLSDLHDVIVQRQAVIKLLKPDELLYRKTQNLLTSLDTLENNGNQTQTTLQHILSILPQDMTLSNFSFGQDTIQFTANIQTFASLKQFFAKVNQNPNVIAINLDKVENKITTNTKVITVSILFKKSAQIL